MNDRFPETFAGALGKLHRNVLESTSELVDEQLCWRPSATTVSIQFHLWHLARWADMFQAMYREFQTGGNQWQGPGCQIWETEQLAKEWGLDAHPSDRLQSGTGMELETAASLQLPREQLFDYTRRVFAEAERAVDDLAASQDLLRSVVVFEFTLTIQGLLFHQLQHTARHQGMIEALRSLLP